MTNRIAPLLIFCYNRPEHLSKVLNALSLNFLISDTEIYFFCDGPKQNSTVEDNNQILKVREIVNSFHYGKSKEVYCQTNNLGLSNSIINGIGIVIKKHENFIVLEDDIVPEQGFLKYMNDALTYYENDERVGCIHGWNYNMEGFLKNQSTFFLRGADCWGWGSWKRAWKLLNPDGSYLLNQIITKKLEYDFNRRNTINFIEMLKDQVLKKNDSWAIRWHASLFLSNKLCLHPRNSIVTNIGMDGSGTHCGNHFFEITNTVSNIPIEKIEVVDCESFYHYFKRNKWQTYLTNLKVKFVRSLKIHRIFGRVITRFGQRH